MEVDLRFKLNTKEFSRWMMDDSFTEASMAIAEKIAAVANATAPYDPKRKKDGEHVKGSYKARPAEIKPPKSGPRAGAEVYSDAEHALAVEIGTFRTKPHRTLTRAAAVVAPGHVHGGGGQGFDEAMKGAGDRPNGGW